MRSALGARRAFGAAAALSGDKVVVTAALNGVLTDPAKFDIPVTPDEMAQAAHEAYNAGATIVHIHFRDQRPGKGHLPAHLSRGRRTVDGTGRARANVQCSRGSYAC